MRVHTTTPTNLGTWCCDYSSWLKRCERGVCELDCIFQCGNNVQKGASLSDLIAARTVWSVLVWEVPKYLFSSKNLMVYLLIIVCKIYWTTHSTRQRCPSIVPNHRLPRPDNNRGKCKYSLALICTHTHTLRAESVIMYFDTFDSWPRPLAPRFLVSHTRCETVRFGCH